VSAAGGPSPDQVRLVGVRYERFEAGGRTHHGRAAEAALERGTRQVVASAVEIEVRDTKLRADRAAGRPGAPILLEGSVEVVDGAGRVLRTERAEWDPDAATIDAPGPVSVEGENFRVAGASMHMELERERIDVAGPVSATVRSR